MDHAALGALGPVRRLTRGGGGLGQLRGESSRAEAVGPLPAEVVARVDRALARAA